MQYNIIDREFSDALKLKIGVEKEEFIDFNFSTAFKLKDFSTLIQPLNPFGKCLHILEKNKFNEYLTDKKFPDLKEVESLYNKYPEIINNLNYNKLVLIKSMFTELNINEVPQDITIEKIEKIYVTLKKLKVLKKYKIHFYMLVFDFLMRQNKDYKLGILEIKQLINPIQKVVLVSNFQNGIYFNIEQEIEDKIDKVGIRYILNRALTINKKSDEFEKLTKLLLA